MSDREDRHIQICISHSYVYIKYICMDPASWKSEELLSPDQQTLRAAAACTPTPNRKGTAMIRSLVFAALLTASFVPSSFAQAAEAGTAGSGPDNVKVTVTGVRSTKGRIRVELTRPSALLS